MAPPVSITMSGTLHITVNFDGDGAIEFVPAPTLVHPDGILIPPRLGLSVIGDEPDLTAGSTSFPAQFGQATITVGDPDDEEPPEPPPEVPGSSTVAVDSDTIWSGSTHVAGLRVVG
jgi:hypothetical protein